MRSFLCTRPKGLFLITVSGVLFAETASADLGMAIHGEGAAAHTVSAESPNEFGWGAVGLIGPEIRFGEAIGFEVPIGAMALMDTDAPTPEGTEAKGTGIAFFAVPGLRVRPLAFVGAGSALWVAGGGGLTRTGDDTHPAVDMRVGYDLESGQATLGPFVGYFQVVKNDGGMFDGDARVAMLGLHGSLGTYSASTTATVGDADRDGILDDVDQCIDQAEDFDSFKDGDGCPDFDNDADGIPDRRDACPIWAEDADGFEDDDGCPDDDNDADGISDPKDACPNVAEDPDAFEDADGCPDPDNDGDGFLDAVDQCPDEPETVNGLADDDGCPDREHATVLGNRIVLDDIIHFSVDQADIQQKSWKVLKDLATLIAEHPEYERIHISGHTDQTGESEYNLRLSAARAQSVRDLLVRFGVAEERLTTHAYGETRPRASGASLPELRQNRRVEFEITRRRGDRDADENWSE